MKYFQCNNPNIKALVALKAIKGESISYLSSTYHVNPENIAIWKQELIQELYLEDWMVALFTKQPSFLGNEKKEESEPF